MSKLLDFFYRKPEKREMKKAARIIYVLLGVGAAAFLMTAYFDVERTVLHQVGTTVCIFGMLGINAAASVRSMGWQRYLLDIRFRRDIGILAIWILLLVIWHMYPEAPVPTPD